MSVDKDVISKGGLPQMVTAPATYSRRRGRMVGVGFDDDAAAPIPDTGEPKAAFGAAWHGAACARCGRRPEDIAPVDAVAATRRLQRRCASLLDRPGDLIGHPRSGPSSWPAIERAVRVSDVLGAVNSRLRSLLGEEALLTEEAVVTAPAETEAPDSGPQQRAAAAAILASLASNVRQLAATIDGATSQDWYRPRPDDVAAAADLVWLALHTATHYLEDAPHTLESTVG